MSAQAPTGAFTVRDIDELDAIHGGSVKLAGAGLGIESFGMQVVDLPPGFPDYPEHDHTDDGQEEVYVVLRGSAEFRVDGKDVAVGEGAMLRVAPSARRKLTPGPDGARVLAIGCTRDGAYERPEHFRAEVGA